MTKGDYVSPESGALATLIQYNPIRVLFSISNKEYLTEVIGSTSPLFADWDIKLKLANGQIYKHLGSAKYHNNEISPQTSSVAVYVDFNNPDQELIANAYVDVLLEKTVKDSFFLPQDLVNLEPDGAFVYILNTSNIIEKAPVTLGVSVGNDYWIKEGLKDNMRVITNRINAESVGKKANIKGAVQ